MQDQLSQEPTQPATDEKPLADDIRDVLAEFDATKKRQVASAIMELLEQRGHIVPGVPPLRQVLADFKRSHDKLTLTTLALRILNMLAFTEVKTPESKPARKFIDDYLTGVNHGPAGEPMLWPGRLPGLAAMLRDWGYVPTIALPGQPSFVAKAAPPVQVN